MKNKDSWKIYILTLVAFMVGTAQFSIAGMLDQIAQATNISISNAGLLVTVYALGNAIGTPIFIMLTTKMKQKKQMVAALLLFLIGVMIMIAAHGFILMVMSRAITGLGAGIYTVTAYGLAVKLAPDNKKGNAMSTVAMGVSSSLVFGVPLGRIISSHLGWRSIFLLIGIFTLLALFLVVKAIPDVASEQVSTTRKESKVSILKNPTVASALLMTLFVFIGFSILDTYITPYLIGNMPSMQSSISFILIILGIGSLIGSRLGGFLADKIGVARTVSGALAFQIVFLVLVSLFTSNEYLGILFIVLWEIACWTFGPI